MKATTTAVALLVAAAAMAAQVVAEQCGSQAGGALCPNCLCCSSYGWCGSTSDYCGDGCQSQCDGCGGGEGFYTYDALVTAAAAFPDFAATGDDEARKLKVAAFLGQTSHETTGGWATGPDGPYSWGYCFKEEIGATASYCVPSAEWPCAPDKKYFGRGPIQLSYNYNYGPAGEAIGEDLLNNPELVASDPVVSFKTALWFWMTPQSPKPSCHDVITGQWTPSSGDIAAGRVPGYGVITNIINGGLECGFGPDDRVANRIGFYQRYCDVLGIGYGSNLDCYDQRPFNSGLTAAQ
ncbi:hypothetical protein OsJ_18468 [Oryza sativa Japonica Group]|uniref:chitinase n=1 Tax=Oryza sativa subsp. japonica TaxID=39947 RepID=B9FPH6_ORYSJ|nr:hypothetical protein OsJ_18468 [Oryza sativa Japonica Group]